MSRRVWDWVKGRIRGRPFEAFQIEVTSRCALRCVMCPRTALAEAWPDLDLSWGAFQRAARAFPSAQWVHLQGWGEPLLHPRLFDMIAAAKAAGCRVGFTTNGMLLDAAVGKELLRLDLDLLVVSIAGSTGPIHEGIRAGSDLAEILWHVGWFLNLRQGRGGGKPKVEVFFLMTTTNVGQLPRVAEMAASLGVDELVATNLDYVVTPEHDALRVFGRPEHRGRFLRVIDEAREQARQAGLAFRVYPLDPEEVAVCEANPLKNLFISCDGWVSPCSYMGLAGRADIPRRFDGRSLAVPRLRFGNVLEQDLLDIWNSAAYRTFREQLARRRLGVAAWAIGSVGGHEEIFERKMPPPPEPCRTCYKLYGV